MLMRTGRILGGGEDRLLMSVVGGIDGVRVWDGSSYIGAHPNGLRLDG